MEITKSLNVETELKLEERILDFCRWVAFKTEILLEVFQKSQHVLPG